MNLKRTPLFSAHEALKARLVDFGGWEMPVQYTSIIDEHNCTREKAGLFDVSHMGEIRVTGKDCMQVLNKLVTNDVSLMTPKKIIYTPVPNEKGGIVDDILIYMVSNEEFLLVVNASNTDKDFKWFTEKAYEIAADSIKMENKSAEYGQIAIQGPSAQKILQKLTTFDLETIKFFYFDYVNISGSEVIVSRTGYTGEDGFEVYCHSADCESLWNAMLEAGKEFGILPVGLGARDTLRFESGLPLYGHELTDDISPIEASLKFFVKLNKGDFIGKEVIKRHVEEGVEKKLVGIELIDKGVPREGYRVFKDGIDIGYIASGTHSPTFKKGLASAFIKTEFTALDTELDVIIRDKKVKAKVVKMPFYTKKTKQI